MKHSQRFGIIYCGFCSMLCLGVFAVILGLLPTYHQLFIPQCDNIEFTYFTENNSTEYGVSPYCSTCDISKMNAVEFAEAETLAKTISGIAFCLFVFTVAITAFQVPSLWRKIKQRRLLHYADFSTSGTSFINIVLRIKCPGIHV